MNTSPNTADQVGPRRAPLLHIKVVATQLGLSPYQVRRLIEDGRLPSETVGKRTYIPAAAVERYIEELAS